MKKALSSVYSICAREKKKFILFLAFVLLIDPGSEEKIRGSGPVLEMKNCVDLSKPFFVQSTTFFKIIGAIFINLR